MTWAEFNWRWIGYTRRIERTVIQTQREILHVLIATNSKGKTPSGRNLMPLQIDIQAPIKTEDEINDLFATAKQLIKNRNKAMKDGTMKHSEPTEPKKDAP